MSIRERPSKKTKRGVTYQVYFDYKDRYGQKKTYVKGGFEKKKDAINHETLMKAELLDKGTIFKDKGLTLDEVFELYIQSIKVKKITKQTYENRYKHHLKNTLGKCKISLIDNTLCQQEFDNMNLKVSTKKNILSLLKDILNYAYNNKLIKDNIVINVTLEPSQKVEKSIIDDKTFLDFLNYLESSYNSVNAKPVILAMWIGYYTGMRIGEVLALEKSDIDLTNNVIHVNKTLSIDIDTNEPYISTPKTEKSNNTVPIVEELKKLLQEYLSNHAYNILISANGDYIKPYTINSVMKRYSKKNNIHISFHLLRHTMATRLCKADVNPKIAQRILRHSNVNTTLNIYTHINEQLAEDTLNEVFENINFEKKPVKNLSNSKNINIVN